MEPTQYWQYFEYVKYFVRTAGPSHNQAVPGYPHQQLVGSLSTDTARDNHALTVTLLRAVARRPISRRIDRRHLCRTDHAFLLRLPRRRATGFEPPAIVRWPIPSRIDVAVWLS